MIDASTLADAWIAVWHRPDTGKPPDPDGSHAVDTLVRADPDAAWSVILTILDRIEPEPDNTVLQVLAAGPARRSLVHREPAVVERTDTQSNRV